MNDRCNLFIKIAGDWERNIDYLYDRLEHLKEIDSEFGLDISKPSRYRIGEYTSLAVVNNIFVENNGRLDLQNMLQKIKQAILLVDRLASDS